VRPPRSAPPRGVLLAVLAVALVAATAACGGTRPRPPDGQYGHRYDGVAPDGRETVLLAPADSTAEVIALPAILDSVVVRPAVAAAPPGAAVPVEVLVKGTLPDACTALDEATQARAGHLITVTLTMRQPRGALCAQVVRPFRFYLPLEGTYAPGHYTLRLNGVAYPFRIREVAPEGG
jgi:hypothetical protein